MLKELNRTGFSKDQDAQANQHKRHDSMRLGANRQANGPMIYEPMGAETLETGHNREHNPNYWHVKPFARG